MDETYTVQNVMPTGKSHATYGTEYYVKFVESEDTFTLWFKTVPKAGDKIDGTINGNKFTKKKKEFVSGQTKTGTPAKRTYGAIQADRGDGMRQGMCFNNAAQYVSDHSSAIENPEVWAKTVFTYAKALYDLGDLNQESEPQTSAELLKDAN